MDYEITTYNDEGRFVAEVFPVGEDDAESAYCTGFYDREDDAERDAAKWIEAQS